MATYVRGFIITDVARVHKKFSELIALSKQTEAAARDPKTRARRRAATRELQRAYREFNRELEDVAKTTSTLATEAIRKKIDATKSGRPPTGKKPGLKSAVRCRPLRIGAKAVATGAVGIADEDVLNRLMNPTSPAYGPYWKAQEYGTGSKEVKSQVGRRIFGFYVGKGAQIDVPRAAYRGGGGPHPIFISAGSPQAVLGPQGGIGGPGTISKEIEGRHFIRDGANAARAEWRRSIEAVQAQAVVRIGEVVAAAAVPAGGRIERAARRRR